MRRVFLMLIYTKFKKKGKSVVSCLDLFDMVHVLVT